MTYKFSSLSPFTKILIFEMEYQLYLTKYNLIFDKYNVPKVKKMLQILAADRFNEEKSWYVKDCLEYWYDQRMLIARTWCKGCRISSALKALAGSLTYTLDIKFLVLNRVHICCERANSARTRTMVAWLR